jgi:hypothetical protein
MYGGNDNRFLIVSYNALVPYGCGEIVFCRMLINAEIIPAEMYFFVAENRNPIGLTGFKVE